MTRLEDWQSPENQLANAVGALRLSQSTQEMFKSNTNFAGQGCQFQALDFGTGADLYRSAAYTGDRLSASTFMTDEPEQKTDAPKLDPAFESLRRPSVIRTKEEEAIWAKTQEAHKLGKDESVTHIGLPPEVIADMQKKGQASKLEFFDSAAEGALNAPQQPPKEKQILLADTSDSKAQMVSDMTRGGLPMSGTLLPEPWMLEAGGDLLGALTKLAMNVTTAKFQEIVESVKKAVVNPIEHPFRGQEENALALVPAASWSDAYKAYPDIQKIGGLSEAQSTKLMKAIVGNELTFYGPEDKAQDAICEAGQGSVIFGKTVGFAQIAPQGVRNLSAEFDKEVKEGTRKSNPLHKLAALPDNDLAKAMLKPENMPILVGAVISHNVQMFNRHKSEVEINSVTLGYMFNPDHVYARSDKKHEHLMTKKEAEKKGILYDPALPTKDILSRSEHAHNIAKWLEKLSG